MTNHIETAEDLERIVAEQTATINALGDLVRAMDARIRALTKLNDNHELRIERLEATKPTAASGGKFDA